jgi:hypothetical protein
MVNLLYELFEASELVHGLNKFTINISIVLALRTTVLDRYPPRCGIATMVGVMERVCMRTGLKTGILPPFSSSQ